MEILFRSGHSGSRLVAQYPQFLALESVGMD